MKPRFLLHLRGFLAFLLLLFGGACLPAPLPCTTAADCKNPSAPACFQGRCQPASCTSDLDCSDPAQPSCQAGSCQPAPLACKHELDCKDFRLPRCQRGQCQAPPCTTDTDCATSLPRCNDGFCRPFCSTDTDCTDLTTPLCRQGRCQPLPTCQTEADCTDPARPWCGFGLCQPRLQECADDTDCPKTRPFCYRDACHATSFACTTDADCKVPFLPVCRQGVCHARPAGSCERDADCKNPAAPRCRRGVCGPLCIGKADCKAPMATCQAGQCSLCADDLDCPPPQLCAESRCVASVAATSCKQDGDCKAPNQEAARCFQGRCLRLLRVGKAIFKPTPKEIPRDRFDLITRDILLWTEQKGSLAATHQLIDYEASSPLTPCPKVFQTGREGRCDEHRCQTQRWEEGKLLWEKSYRWFIDAGQDRFAPCEADASEQGDTFWLVGAGVGKYHELQGEPPLPRAPSIHLSSYERQGKLRWRKTLAWGPEFPSDVVYGASWSDEFHVRVFPSGESLLFSKFGLLNASHKPSPLYLDLGDRRLPAEWADSRPFLIKLSTNGQVLWIRFLSHWIEDVRVEPQGSFYVLGKLSHGRWQEQRLPVSGKTSAYVAKFDKDGNLQWLTNAGGGSSHFRVAESGHLGVFVGVGRESSISFGGWTLPLPPLEPEYGSFQLLAQLSSEGVWEWALVRGNFVDDMLLSFERGRWLLLEDNLPTSSFAERSSRGQLLWKIPQKSVFPYNFFPQSGLFFRQPSGLIFSSSFFYQHGENGLWDAPLPPLPFGGTFLFFHQFSLDLLQGVP